MGDILQVAFLVTFCERKSSGSDLTESVPGGAIDNMYVASGAVLLA